MKQGRFVDDNAPPLRWPWWLSMVLCAVGLTLSILLERIHIKIHSDPAFHSFCSVDRTVNCDIVARSSYAVLLGVPVAVWGILGYVVAGFVAIWGARRRETRVAAGCALYLASAFTLTRVGLGAVSAFLISAVCLLCIATYGVNVLLLLCAIVAARNRGLRSSFAEPWRALRSRRGVLSLVILVACAVLLIVVYPSYWKPAQSAERSTPTEPTVPHGIEPGGGHFIGAEKPAVTLLEFSLSL